MAQIVGLTLVLFAYNAAAQGDFCVLGGSTTATVECYDGTTWNALPSMNTARSDVAAVGYNGFLCAIGGYDGSIHLNTVECYGTQWTNVANMGTARTGAAAVMHNGIPCVLGGVSTGVNYVASAECYQSGGTWVPLPAMNSERASFGAAVYNGDICALGGHYFGTDMDSVECYDGIQWSFRTPMSTARSGHGVVVYRGDLCAVGGTPNGTNTLLDTAECFDGSVWNALPAMSRPRHTLAVVVYNDNLCAAGGYDGSEVQASVECYDGTSWSAFAPMTTARKAFGATIYISMSTPTSTPTSTVTGAPTSAPTSAPTGSPTPSEMPTSSPSWAPSSTPSAAPSLATSSVPSLAPSVEPTSVDSLTASVGTTCDSLLLPNAPNGTSLMCSGSNTQFPQGTGTGGVGDVVSSVVTIVLLNGDGEEVRVSDLDPDEAVVFTLLLTQTSLNSTNNPASNELDPCRNNQPACAWWDGDHDTWSFEGCTTDGQQQHQLQCRCTHLTEFALVVHAVDSSEPICGVPDPSLGHIVLAVLYGLAGVAACLQAVRLALASRSSKKNVDGSPQLIVQHVGMTVLCVVRVVVLALRVAPPRPSAELLVALASVSYVADVLLFHDLVWTFVSAFLVMKRDLLARLKPVLLVLCGVTVAMLLLLSILVAALPPPAKVQVAVAGSYIMASVVSCFSLCVFVFGMSVVRLVRAGDRATATAKKQSVAPKLAWCTILLSLSLALGSVCWVLSIQKPLHVSAASRNFALAVEISAYALGLANVVVLLYLRFASVNARARFAPNENKMMVSMSST